MAFLRSDPAPVFTCFGRPGVPPTNNQAERSLRPLVIMRKVVQGTRSDKGLENHSVMRSLFETARRQGKKPQEFFLTLLTKTTARAQASTLPQTVAQARGKDAAGRTQKTTVTTS